MRPSHICLHLSLKKYALLCVNVSGYCVQLCCPSRPQPFFRFRGLSRGGGGGEHIYIYIYTAYNVGTPAVEARGVGMMGFRNSLASMGYEAL